MILPIVSLKIQKTGQYYTRRDTHIVKKSISRYRVCPAGVSVPSRRTHRRPRRIKKKEKKTRANGIGLRA